MALKDLFNKGMDMLKNGVNEAKQAAADKKSAMQEFDLLKTKSNHIGPMEIINPKNEDPQPGREQLILMMNANISVDQAKLVNRLIPVEETLLNVKMTRESKTEIEYIFAITNKKIWILNQNEYVTYEFSSIEKFEIINKGMMSQGVNFNNNAFVITGKEEDIQTLIDIIMNPTVRENVITTKTKYLCGVTPRRQILNLNMKGITVGDNKMIVLHNTPDNKVVSLNEIAYVQLLMNDSVVLVKGKPGVDQGSMVSSPLEARKMAVKVILSMGEYIIETMPSSMMNKSYKREDSTYINNYEYSKKLVDAIAELIEENRKSHAQISKPQTATEQTPNPTPTPTTNIPNASDVFKTPTETTNAKETETFNLD